MTTTYELHQLDENGVFQRIYRNLCRNTAISNLSLELSEPTQKGKWKAVRVETTVEKFEEDLVNNSL